MMISYGTIGLVASGVALAANIARDLANEKKQREWIKEEVRNEFNQYNQKPENENKEN